jgi:hypothetical protein
MDGRINALHCLQKKNGDENVRNQEWKLLRKNFTVFNELKLNTFHCKGRGKGNSGSNPK